MRLQLQSMALGNAKNMGDFVTPDGGEIDEVANRIHARIARSVQGGERR